MIRVESLADHPELIEQVGVLRWQEWAYGKKDPSPFIETTAAEAGHDHLPMTLVAINDMGEAVGAVGLGEIDDELNATERNGRTPWILGMVVRRQDRNQQIGRQLLTGVQGLADQLGNGQTWVATGKEAVGFYRRCGWQDVDTLHLVSTGISTTVLRKATRD